MLGFIYSIIKYIFYNTNIKSKPPYLQAILTDTTTKIEAVSPHTS